MPWYEGAERQRSTPGTPSGRRVVLLIAAACAALALVLEHVAERSRRCPVATAVWSVLFGLIGVDRRGRARARATRSRDLALRGAWLALVGAVAILAGAWQSMRDERTVAVPGPPRRQPRPRRSLRRAPRVT